MWRTTGHRRRKNRKSPGSPLRPNRIRRKGCGYSFRRCLGQITSCIVTDRWRKKMKRFLTRRQALQEAAIGFGAMAVNSMLQQDRLFAAEATLAKERVYDLTPKQPHFAAK